MSNRRIYIRPKTETKKPEKPKFKINKNGYYITEKNCLVHREVYKIFHRRIIYGWQIHHINFDKLDNTIDNLIQLPREFHKLLHTNHSTSIPRDSIVDWLNDWTKERSTAKKKRGLSNAARQELYFKSQLLFPENPRITSI